MDVGLYLRFAIALALVMAMIAGAAWLVRRLGIAGATPVNRTGRRLALVESLALDTKRRLVLVRRDGTEHLILLGANSDVVVEAGTPVPAEKDAQ